MLLILGISCKLQAVALFEDIHYDEEPQDSNCPGPNNKPALSLRQENVEEGYNNAAW